MSRGRAWPIGIVVVLTLTVAANVWVMRVAGSDPSFAIEPDYYARAVAWDSTMAQEARNRALGWSVDAHLLGFVPDSGGHLAVMIRDASGAPLRDARVHVRALSVARSATRVDVELQPSAEQYIATIPLRHGGAWELRFDVRKGDDRLSVTRRVAVPVTAHSRNRT